uniref:Enoyl reductase (ER) domain-containing protein n=1 Tax=Salarias fasciatus TaxID=181472 RepID=A0A672G5M9_SALFA
MSATPPLFLSFKHNSTRGGTEVIKCKAAVAWESNKPLVIEEIEVAPPEANEIRVKIVTTGLCHTDLYQLYDNKHPDALPTVLGHEGAGIVESVGPGVTEFQPGDKVIPLPISQCGECRFCKSGRSNHCDEGCLTPKHSFTCRGKKVYQFMGTSTFSEYTVVHKNDLAKIDAAAPLDKVFLFGCAVSTGYGAAINSAQVTPGSTCAVFGLGAVGLAAVMGCRNAGAKKIFAVDINPDKFDRAKALGATDTINPKDYDKPVSQVLADLTNGGVDFSIECTGNVEVMRSAFEACVKGWGVSVVVGYTDLHDFASRPAQLISGRTWKGSLWGGYRPKDGVADLGKALLAKRLNLEEFISHKMTLNEVNDAIELMKKGQWYASSLFIIHDL